MTAAANSTTAAAILGHFLRCFTRLINIGASEYREVSARLLIFSSQILLGICFLLLLAGRTVLPLDPEGTGTKLIPHFRHCIDVDMSKY